jgi:3-oxoacyl-[acyl-carrier-protein] synthase II
MRLRVVITGMGVVTPLGDTPDDLFRSQIEGRSGVGPITRFDASTFPTTFAAEVRDFSLARYVRDPSLWRDAGEASQLAAAASQRALADAGLLEDGDRTRFGVYLGTGEGRQDFDAVQELHTPSAHLAEHFGLEGPCCSCLTACAAGTQALGEALELIRADEADVMLAGGAHSMIHPFGITGFNLLTALSVRNDAPQRASRPFDLHRDGFVLGEGAGLLVLEELEHAKRRGARIYAELTGYGTTADAFRITDSHPDGRGAIACIQGALRNSGLAASDIGYINAHGTSTQVNDRVETLAIKKVFGDGAYEIPISSSKSTMGHLIAAAGAAELIICVMALERGILPPTINYEVPDPECDLDYIPNTPREKRVRHVLSNSFGFGGQNVSLIVSRC